MNIKWFKCQNICIQYNKIYCWTISIFFPHDFRVCTFVVINTIFIDIESHKQQDCCLFHQVKFPESHNIAPNNVGTQLIQQHTHFSCLNWKPDFQQCAGSIQSLYSKYFSSQQCTVFLNNWLKEGSFTPTSTKSASPV